MIPDLECRNLSKKFGDFTAVDNVSFSVPAGTFFSILGPSGCGKTTIMRMIAGFLETTSGEIEIKGRSMLEVAPNKRPVNMVFQHLALFPMMNIEDNVGYGLRRAGMSKREIAIKVGDVLERIGLPGVQKRKIEQLSGGQKQRIAIARCMVLEPDVLLLDEPLGALDLKLREHMKVELKKLQTSFDTTFIYITHDQSEALVMSDQVAVMNSGHFEQLGEARDLYYKPQTSFVAGFVGDSNRWRGKVENTDGASLKVRTKDGVTIKATTSASPLKASPLKEGQSAEIFVRPESIRVALKQSDISHLENRISGKVSSVLFNGANSRILVHDIKTDSEIDVALPQSGEFASLTRGAPVHIGWGAAQSLCFALEDQK